MKSVHYDRTLIYYDGPQVFLARDLSGSAFVGVLIEQSNETDKYVVVQVIGAFIEMFLRGEIDLLRLMLSRVGPGWYLTEISDGFEGSISLILQPNSLEDFPHLPKPGLYIKATEDYFWRALSGAGWHATSTLAFHAYISAAAQPCFDNYNTPLLIHAAHYGSLAQTSLGLGTLPNPTGVLISSDTDLAVATTKYLLHANNNTLALAA
jgi:hypothetical protein